MKIDADPIPFPIQNYSFDSPRPQDFSLPLDIINYLINSCASSNIFQKLQQTCKYVLFKTKIIVVDDEVACDENFLKYRFQQNNTERYQYVKLSENFQYWLTDFFMICGGFSSALNYLYRCDLVILVIEDENLTFKELCFLLNGEKIEDLSIREVTIWKADETPATLDEIMVQCPKISILEYSHKNETFSTKTFENLAQMKFIYKLAKLDLIIWKMDEEKIDPKILCHYLKKYLASTATKSHIVFNCYFSQSDFNIFHSKAKEILGNYFTDFSIILNPPF